MQQQVQYEGVRPELPAPLGGPTARWCGQPAQVIGAAMSDVEDAIPEPVVKCSCMQCRQISAR